MATLEGVKAKIQGLIDKSNEATGNTDTTMTDAVDTLIGGLSRPQEKTVDVVDNGSIDVLPDEGYTLSKVTVNTNVVAGVAMNLAYGNTPPEDTSKVWLKTGAPRSVNVTPNPTFTEALGRTNTTLTTTLPYKMYRMESAVHGNKIYMFGGVIYDEINKTTSYSDKIIVFDTTTETVTELEAKLPVATYRFGCETVGDYIYLLSNVLQCRFNVKTETIENIQTDQIIDTAKTSAVIGDIIYLFNQENYNASPIHTFDTKTNLLSAVQDVKISGFGGLGSVIAIDTKIYIFTGRIVRVFDTVAKTITTVYAHTSDIFDYLRLLYGGGRVLLGVGVRNNSTPVRYDICENIYIEMTSLLPIYAFYNKGLKYTYASYPQFMAAETVGDTIYMLGGCNSQANTSYAYNFYNQMSKHKWSRGKVEADDQNLVVYTTDAIGVNIPIINEDNGIITVGGTEYYKGNSTGVGEPVEAYVYDSTTNEWVPARKEI